MIDWLPYRTKHIGQFGVNIIEGTLLTLVQCKLALDVDVSKMKPSAQIIKLFLYLIIIIKKTIVTSCIRPKLK